MSFIKRKHCSNLLIIFLFILLANCQLKDPKKTHGINFLEQREKVLIVNKTNRNDVIQLLGKPHSTSITGSNNWIYFERTITKGKMHNLGKNILKKNNILELSFDKFGVLQSKELKNKKNMNKVAYTKKKTTNTVTQQSVVGKFLNSVRQKMYGNRKSKN
ncbi:outer membrane protein assembly factor BamE [Pelagibacteraceae bacterium]|nr:outer membrane protein assembly factor BamE [Pelagibacteraceae bacterium]